MRGVKRVVVVQPSRFYHHTPSSTRTRGKGSRSPDAPAAAAGRDRANYDHCIDCICPSVACRHVEWPCSLIHAVFIVL